MKLCYDMLDKIRLSSGGKYWINKYSKSKLYLYGRCGKCGDPYLGQKRSNGFCSKECSSSGKNNGMSGMTGDKNPFYGKTHTDKTKKMISKSRKGKCTGSENHNYNNSENLSKDKNPNWKGGNYCYKCGCLIPVRRRMCVSCNNLWRQEVNLRRLSGDKLYSDEWTPNLRKHIRHRDMNRCQNPFCTGYHYRLDVHHIDYNKMNCSVDNLITLCVSCHASINSVLLKDWYHNWYSILVEKKYVNES